MLEGLGTWEFREANRRTAQIGELAELTEVDLLFLLDRVPALPAQYPGAFTLEHRGHSIIWYNFESLVWTLGESFRRVLKRQRSLRRSVPLWSQVEALCLDSRYGKGRESFTMLLGQYGGLARVPVLVRLLDDPAVHGHALYALRLLGAPEGRDRAKQLLGSPKAWICREARKYLAEVG